MDLRTKFPEGSWGEGVASGSYMEATPAGLLFNAWLWLW